ncbi:MAG: nucleotidyltransferase family protein [Candidatus Altiarchaeales archaeon]|nr:nucleotidyltransferase family protein [Candidatus Altiarchaeota archaeon]MBU4340999.1 nucleotidyltransferase family protein [Candidatus Altiarchaeota archaeon]MBU4406077.1 nucleotidyltransferase family protein [Candidatus Altiarchaeota archaeon]MCG2783184.1 nucleotidyltransferase family protein [Candidatus Altiarchaeales archaeon]
MCANSISIDEEILEEIDEFIDDDRIKNRSDAVNFLLSRALSSTRVRRALILAGGKGTRMRPFTYEIPKPLIPVHEKPLVQHIIELLRKNGIKNITMSIGYMGDRIQSRLGNGSDLNVRIEYIVEEEELGTAGSLHLLKEKPDRSFFMFNGDVLANIELHDMIHFHRKNKGLATIALTAVDEPSRFGVAKLEGDKILEFVEKPEPGKEPSKFINAGVYLLEPEVIDYVPEGRSMMETDVFPRLAKEGNLYGYKFKGQWFDTGTHEAYEKAIKGWRDIE